MSFRLLIGILIALFIQLTIAEVASTASIPVCKNRPHYWSSSGEPRLVRLGRYGIISYPKDKKRWSLYDQFAHRMSATVGHHEVFIGNTSFSIFAAKQKQEITIRPVTQSNRVGGFFLHRQNRMCVTTKTDSEILEFVQTKWRGAYHSLKHNCRSFANMVVGFVCNGKRIPWRFRYLEKFGLAWYNLYRKLFKESSWLGRKIERRISQHDPSNVDWSINIVMRDDSDRLGIQGRPPVCNFFSRGSATPGPKKKKWFDFTRRN